MRIDQFNGILSFLTVAKKKSFSAAAAELRVTPSAISQSIKQLESRLGVALVSRTTRSIGLTESGQKFLNRCGPALEVVLDSIEKISELESTPAGLLRINLSRASYPTVIEPVLKKFIQAYPSISVELFFDDDLGNIVEGGYDAGIRLSETVEKDMTAVKVHPPFRFVVAGSPKYLNKYGRPRSPKDLLQHSCIRFRYSDGTMYERWEFENKGKNINVNISGRLIVNDSQIMINAAVEGQGLIYTLEPTISSLLKNGELEKVLSEYAPKSEGYFLYFPCHAQRLPKLRAFIDFFKKNKSD